MIVRCRHCGLDVEAPPGSLDQLLRCPSCDETFRCEIPRAEIVDGVAAVALTYKELVVRAGERRIKPKDRIYYAPKDATLHARDIPGLFPDIDAKRPKPPKRFTPSGSLSADAGAAADALASLEQEAEADDEKV